MFRLHYDFVDELGFVHRGGFVDCATHEEAEKKYAELKDKRGYANVFYNETVVETHYVEVAFKTYDFIVEGPIKKGQMVEAVMENGNKICGKVVAITTKKDIKYKKAVPVKGRCR